MYYLVLAVAGVGILWVISNSQWAKEIKHRTLYSSPFPVPVIKHDQRPIAVVSKYDVLLNDRLDFKNLGSMSDALDYQGGNIKFKSTVKAASKIARYLKTQDLMRLVQNILNGMKREASRFLVQNEFTDWVVLSDSDATAFTTQAILLESFPLLKALHKEARFLLASYKYGRRYKGAMANLYSPLHIRSIMSDLMKSGGITPFYFDSPTPDRIQSTNTSTNKTIHQQKARSNLHNPRTYTSVPLLSTKQHRKRFHSFPWYVTIRNDGMLVLGDVVDAQYHGMYNEYYKGEIVNIREGSIVDVKYADGEIDVDLEPHHLSKFVPYSIGERVQVKVFPNGDYIEAKILNGTSEDVVKARLMESRRIVTVTQGWIRRIKRFFVGDVVGAIMDEDEDVSMATVIKENTDGTVNIEFEDGEKAYYVSVSSLRDW
jgi:hypothetical protein